ncbi:MAG TPA: hypothetical protein PKE30_16760 [Niabella sp.]|nr:hypothetical protein [Niabella sp.]
MAYNRNNHLRRINAIVAVYQKEKHHDVPDTFIVAKIFPKHNIHISYRTWMYIKSTPLKQSQSQLSLFN